MAIRLILAASIGGIVLMAWGVFHWFVLPVEQVVSHVPEEAELLSALRRLPSAGVYVLPYPLDPATEAGFETDFLSAPRWTIFYGPGGDDPFGVPVFAIGLLHAIAAAAVISVLVLLGGVEQLGRGRRYVFILLAGASGSYISEMLYVIWFHHPGYFHARMVLFQAGGWVFAALPMAAILRAGP